VAISRRLLSDDEHVVVATRTHIKALLWPSVLLIVIAAAAGYVSTFAPGGKAHPLLVAVIWGIAVVVAFWLVVRRFLEWLTTTYTITNRRLITRTGVLSRRGHDIPLQRISDVAYDRGLLDRMLGCGTLILSDATEHGQVELHDIPHVEKVQLQVSDLLFGSGADGGSYQGARRVDDGT
jgi:uncharacterized membrane protein YdbT with pleckstrin-like domain